MQGLIANLQSRVNFLDAQVQCGMERAPLQASQVNALLVAIRAVSGRIGIEDATAVTAEINNGPWTAAEKVTMVSAVGDACATVHSARSGTRKTQWTRIEHFITKKEWEILRDPEVQLNIKQLVIAKRLYKNGIVCMSEPLIKRCVALLQVEAMKEMHLDPNSQRVIGKALQEQVKGMDRNSRYPLAHLVPYPLSPSDLPADAFSFAYDETDGPISVEVPNLNDIVLTMPYRSTHRALSPSTTAKPSANVAPDVVMQNALTNALAPLLQMLGGPAPQTQSGAAGLTFFAPRGPQTLQIGLKHLQALTEERHTPPKFGRDASSGQLALGNGVADLPPSEESPDLGVPKAPEEMLTGTERRDPLKEIERNLRAASDAAKGNGKSMRNNTKKNGKAKAKAKAVASETPPSKPAGKAKGKAKAKAKGKPRGRPPMPKAKAKPAEAI